LDAEGILEGQQRMKIKNLLEGLNAQQRSVPQLPADAKAKHISVLGAKTDPKHPFAGYMVGAGESVEPGAKRLGPDKNDPWEQGWRANPARADNPYQQGTREHAQWADGQAERQAQPNHYDEGVAEGRAGVDDRDTVGFSVNTEAAYTAVMKRFGDVIDHDETSGVMYAPAGVWPRIEMVAFDADGEGAVRDDGVDESGVTEVAEPTDDNRGFFRGEIKKLKDGSYIATNAAGNRKQFNNRSDAEKFLNGIAEGERNEMDTPAVQAALAKMAERHRGEKWSKEQLAALGKRIAARGQKSVKEDDVEDFLARGGKITQVKPNRGPRNPGLSLGSKHIGGGGDGTRASRTGRGSKPQGKPVVAVESDVEEGWKSKLAGAALAGAAAFGGGAQAQTAPADTTNAAVVQSLINPVAQQRFAKMHADTTAKLTDPRYTHNPSALAQHQATPQQQHAEMLQNIKNIEQWDNPYRIIQMAMNMAGVTPKEVLQNLPKGYKLPTTEPKGTFVPKDLSKLNVKEDEVEEGWKSKLAGAALAGAAALGGGAAAAHDHGDYGHYDQRVDNPSWGTAGYDSHIKSNTNLTKTTTPDGQVKRDSQRRISDVTGPNAQGEYRVWVGQNGKTISSYVTKTPPQNWMVKEAVTKEDIITKLKARLGDYLSDISKEIKKDPDLVDKLAAKPAGDQMGPPVKTVTTDDGHEIQIHGNEDDGFRISIKNKPAASKFANLDEAVMACEMYCARRRSQTLNADYVEEA
jgi:hypothetical protein